MKIQKILVFVPVLALTACRFPAAHTQAVCSTNNFVSLDAMVGDLEIEGKATQLHTLPAVLKKDADFTYELQTMQGNTKFTSCEISGQTILDILPESKGGAYLLGFLAPTSVQSHYTLSMGELKDDTANRLVNNENLSPEQVVAQLMPEFKNYGLNIKVPKR